MASMLSQVFPLEGRSPDSITRNEIMQVVEDAPKIYSYGDTRIARISSSIVVKYGSVVNICEARTMRLAEGTPNVRLPHVFDAWETNTTQPQETKVTYIVRAYIPGDVVGEVWPALNSESRLSIHQQVYGMVQELQRRKMSVPGPVGGGLSNGAFFTDYGAGPFRSQQDMEEWFNERLLVCREFGRVDSAQPSFTGQFQELVLCHFDLHPHNMILDHQGNVWLIDWAFAGAYPPYFERAALLRNGDPDFVQGLLTLMDDSQYAEEIRCLNAIGFALSTAPFYKPSARFPTKSVSEPCRVYRSSPEPESSNMVQGLVEVTKV